MRLLLLLLLLLRPAHHHQTDSLLFVSPFSARPGRDLHPKRELHRSNFRPAEIEAAGTRRRCAQFVTPARLDASQPASQEELLCERAKSQARFHYRQRRAKGRGRCRVGRPTARRQCSGVTFVCLPARPHDLQTNRQTARATRPDSTRRLLCRQSDKDDGDNRLFSAQPSIVKITGVHSGRVSRRLAGSPLCARSRENSGGAS